MKLYLPFILVLLCTIQSNLCIAQSGNFVPGYYVDRNGDTARGYAALYDDRKFYRFNFKSQLQDKDFETVYFDKCRVVSFGKNVYLNWYGARSMEYVEKFEFNIINLDSVKRESIPLILLFSGPRLSLYYYFDVTDHYFAARGDSIFELPIKYRYLTDWEKRTYKLNPPTYLITPVYRYRILDLMNGQLTNKQQMLVEEVEFDKRALVKLFKIINK